MRGLPLPLLCPCPRNKTLRAHGPPRHSPGCRALLPSGNHKRETKGANQLSRLLAIWSQQAYTDVSAHRAREDKMPLNLHTLALERICKRAVGNTHMHARALECTSALRRRRRVPAAPVSF